MLRIQGELRAAETAQKTTPGLKSFAQTGAAWTGESVTETSALTISAMWRAVHLRASAVGTTPLILYRRKGDNKERHRESPTYRLLHDRPNPEMTAVTFKETLQAHVEVYGNAYAEIEWNNAMKPVALWPIPPNWVTPFREKNGSLWYGVQLPEGRNTRVALPASDVVHIPGLGFDGVQGYSVLSYARQSLSLALGQEKFVGTAFKGRAVPTGVLTTDKTLTEEATDRMRAGWTRMYGGLDPESRVAILEEGTKFQQLAFNHEDMQLLQSRKFSVLEVARWTNTPPHLLFDLERATFSNIEEQGLDYLKFGLLPSFTKWEQELNRKLLNDDARQFFEFFPQALLRAETLRRYQSYSLAIKDGWMTRNEVRRAENLNDMEGADELLVPMNMAPASGENEPDGTDGNAVDQSSTSGASGDAN